jgi:hypothetical protein
MRIITSDNSPIIVLSKRNPIGKSICLKPEMYSVLPAGHNPKTPEDPNSELNRLTYLQASSGIYLRRQALFF